MRLIDYVESMGKLQRYAGSSLLRRPSMAIREAMAAAAGRSKGLAEDLSQRLLHRRSLSKLTREWWAYVGPP